MWAAKTHRSQTPSQNKTSLATDKTIQLHPPTSQVTGMTKDPTGFSFSRFPSPAVHWCLIKPCKDPNLFHTPPSQKHLLSALDLSSSAPCWLTQETGKFHAFPSLYFIQVITLFWEGFYSINFTRKTLTFSSITFVSYLWILWQLLFPSAIQFCKTFQIISMSPI